ncbi:MAG: hypothetical protein IJP61_04120 [Treponema sp.]|nr:hypothetical protein [Treponema sp.]
MQFFETESEMLKYGENFSKHDIETVMCNGKKIVLCGSGSPFEDLIWEIAEEALSKMAKVFIKKDVVDESIEKGIGCDTGATPAIRDFILEKVEDIFDFKVVTVRDGGY